MRFTVLASTILLSASSTLGQRLTVSNGGIVTVYPTPTEPTTEPLMTIQTSVPTTLPGHMTGPPVIVTTSESESRCLQVCTGDSGCSNPCTPSGTPSGTSPLTQPLRSTPEVSALPSTGTSAGASSSSGAGSAAPTSGGSTVVTTTSRPSGSGASSSTGAAQATGAASSARGMGALSELFLMLGFGWAFL